MSIKKRRIVYLSDEAWDAAGQQAKPYKSSKSAYIESLIVGGRVIPLAISEAIREAEDKLRKDLSLPPDLRVEFGQTPLPTRKAQQAERDRILRAMNKG